MAAAQNSSPMQIESTTTGNKQDLQSPQSQATDKKQSVRGFSIIVEDQNGERVAKALVRLTNEKTGKETEISTNEKGFLRIENLRAGTYFLRIRGNGFSAEEREHLTLPRQKPLHVTLVEALMGDIAITSEPPSLQDPAPVPPEPPQLEAPQMPPPPPGPDSATFVTEPMETVLVSEVVAVHKPNPIKRFFGKVGGIFK